MTKYSIFILGLFIFCIAAPVFAQDAKMLEAGKKAFMDNKCNMCHSVAAEGITKTMKSSSKTGPPDLSGIGAKQNADFFVKYLKKEADLNGKKHSKTWTGKDEDIQTIAKWLESLKKPAENK